MNNKFVFEIGLEELPAAYSYSAMDQFKALIIKKLEENRVAFDKIEVLGTPRRITAVIEGLADRQEDLEEEIKGPAKKIAVDENGEFSKAAKGFMKSKGIDEKDVFFKDLKGTEYMFAVKKEEGIAAEEILKVILPEAIRGITFPKTMHWGGKNIKFVRPIRWLLALKGDKVVEIDLEGIVASNKTNGHRFLGEKNIEVADVEDYFKKLEENYVVLDHNKRREMIVEGSKAVAASIGGEVELDEDLVDEVNFLVEYPTPFYGEFDKDYLKLPKEVVITPMKQHQRYFPVLKGDKLLPYFIGVRNGDDYRIENVKKGNEKVLEARLADALFFYDEDIKHKLEDYREKLKTVVFQDKLGTIFEKTERLSELAPVLLTHASDKEVNAADIRRAALLSKADLVTQMVFEFDELQGYMGKEYGKVSGENEVVTTSIFEHYLPRFAGDILPSTLEGSVLSIADKIDSICGFFAIGIQPTGSQDPYALRRQALGILNIIRENEVKLTLSEMLNASLDNYKNLQFNKDEVIRNLVEFFKERIRNMLRDMSIRYDVIEAVLCSDIDEVYDIFNIAIELNKWVQEGDLEEVLTALNRVSTLAEKSDNSNVDEALLKEDAEKKLFDRFNEIKPVFMGLFEEKQYQKALDEISNLKPEIDSFFDSIMVMDENLDIRANRLALLKQIYDTMLVICDLSKIVYK